MRTHVNSKGKIPSTWGSEEDQTLDTASCRTANPAHYRLSYSSPFTLNMSYQKNCCLPILWVFICTLSWVHFVSSCSFLSVYHFVFVLILMNRMWIYVRSCVGLANPLAILQGENFEHWKSCANISTKFCLTCHTYRHHSYVLFYSTSLYLDLGFWSQCQLMTKPVCIIYLHTFQLNGMKFDMVLKQFKLKIMNGILIEICGTKGNTCCFTK